MFQLQNKLVIECKDFATGEWAPAPACLETKEPLHFLVGQDGFFRCTFQLDDALSAFLERAARNEDSWACRVPMTHDRHAYLPMVLPLWLENVHGSTFINTHINVVFHLDGGIIIGASAYSGTLGIMGLHCC